MKRPALLIAAAAVVLVAGGALGAVVAPNTTTPTPTTAPPIFKTPLSVTAPAPLAFFATPPGREADGSALPPNQTGNPNMNCGPDVTGQLQRFFNNLPTSVTTVNFRQDACYTVNNGILLQNRSNLTINGNGATFNAWPPSGGRFIAIAAASTGMTTGTITVADSTGIIVGMNVSGTNVTDPNAVVSAVNHTTDVVTIANDSPGPPVVGTTCSPATSTGCYTFTCNQGSCDSGPPVLFLAQDSNITINALNIQGAWDGSPNLTGMCHCGHGVWYEGKVGMMLQGNTNVVINDSTIQGTQGDGFSLQLPTGVGGGTGNLPGNPLNQNITLADSTLNNIGYTITMEAVDGVTLTGNTINNYQQVDFEVDDAATSFSCQSCPPKFAAQDDVNMVANVFSNFNIFWFTSLQGGNPIPNAAVANITPTSTNSPTNTQLTFVPSDMAKVKPGMVVAGDGIGTGSPPSWATVSHVNTTTGVVTLSAAASPGPLDTAKKYKFSTATCALTGRSFCLPAGCQGTDCNAWFGIQEQNLNFSGNTIKCGSTPCQLIQVAGSPPSVFQNRSLNIGLTFTGNTLKGTAKSTSGGSPCTHNSGSAISIHNVQRVTIANNYFPADTGQCGPPTNPPFAYLGMIEFKNVNVATVKNNNFTGAFDVFNTTSSGNSGILECNNIYGNLGQTTSSPCP